MITEISDLLVLHFFDVFQLHVVYKPNQHFLLLMELEDWGWGECVRQEGGEVIDMRIGDEESVCGRKEGRSVT